PVLAPGSCNTPLPRRFFLGCSSLLPPNRPNMSRNTPPTELEASLSLDLMTTTSSSLLEASADGRGRERVRGPVAVATFPPPLLPRLPLPVAGALVVALAVLASGATISASGCCSATYLA